MLAKYELLVELGYRAFALLLVIGCSGASPATPDAGVGVGLDGGAETERGRVSVLNTVMGNGFGNGVDARFPRGPDGCTRSVHSECTLTNCGPGVGFFSWERSESASAGVLTFNGFFLIGQTRPLTLALPYTTQSARPVQLWNGGEALEVHASGGEVPAFSARVDAPSPFTVAKPECTSEGCVFELDRTKPLMCEWSTGDVGEVVVRVGLNRYETVPLGGLWLKRVTELECRYPVESRRATLTPTLLGFFSPLGDEEATIEIERRSTVHLASDGGTITFEAVWRALSLTATVR